MTNNKDSTFLYIEPYVHFSVSKGSILFYNTLSRKTLLYFYSISLRKKVLALSDPQSCYTIRLTRNEFQKREIQDFIMFLRKYYLGDIWDATWSDSPPFNLPPYPAVKNDVPSDINSGGKVPEDFKMKYYLRELICCLNSDTSDKMNDLIHGFPQFTFPAPLSHEYNELPWEIIQQILEVDFSGESIQLTCTGSDILRYSSWDKLLQRIAQIKIRTRLFLDYRKVTKKDLASMLRLSQIRIELFVTFPLLHKNMTEILKFPEKHDHMELRLVFRNEVEMKKVQEFASKARNFRISFLPYFNYKNSTFFKDIVFITMDDIKKGRPDQREILSRHSINEHDFGKFLILPDGQVHANFNDPPLGNIRNHSLKRLIIKEMQEGISWKRTRLKVNPCKNCLYYFLCPPVSNYELFMNRFNFCKIHDGKNLDHE